MKIGQKYDNRIDIYSWSMVAKKILSTCLISEEDTVPRTSPLPSTASMLERSFRQSLVEPGIAERPEDRPTPTSIEAMFNRVLGTLNTEWPPFKTIFATKILPIRCYRCNGVEKVLRKDLQQVLKALSLSGTISHSTQTGWSHGKGKLINLRSAAEHCRRQNLTSLASTLMDDLGTSQTEKRESVIDFSVAVPVYYHAPSRIVNPEPIILLAEAGNMTPPSALSNARWWNIYGPRKWTGKYVDHSSFDILS